VSKTEPRFLPPSPASPLVFAISTNTVTIYSVTET
jgi:hypothetical protein